MPTTASPPEFPLNSASASNWHAGYAVQEWLEIGRRLDHLK
jgi:hypothetical protein